MRVGNICCVSGAGCGVGVGIECVGVAGAVVGAVVGAINQDVDPISMVITRHAGIINANINRSSKLRRIGFIIAVKRGWGGAFNQLLTVIRGHRWLVK